ncbi:hypothetical protein C8R44DRAFT_742524 [Mycena epipterygia]|nr:hypothetical protein C8R44DRAFT_742524 [Mycena epipterygia]
MAFERPMLEADERALIAVGSGLHAGGNRSLFREIPINVCSPPTEAQEFGVSPRESSTLSARPTQSRMKNQSQKIKTETHEVHGFIDACVHIEIFHMHRNVQSWILASFLFPRLYDFRHPESNGEEGSMGKGVETGHPETMNRTEAEDTERAREDKTSETRNEAGCATIGHGSFEQGIQGIIRVKKHTGLGSLMKNTTTLIKDLISL